MATLTELAHNVLDHLFITEGAETPDASDSAKVLERLRKVLARLPEYGGGRRLVDGSATVSTTVRPDTRTICQASGLVITLPSDPEDGARVAVSLLTGTAQVKSGDRKLESATATLTISDNTTWIYRADSIDWVKVTSLADNAESPYGEDADSAIEFVTALECAPIFAVTIRPELAESIRDAKTFLRSKYSRPAEQNWAKSVPYSIQGPARLRSYR